MEFKVDVGDTVLDALKRCTFSVKSCPASPVEILTFPKDKEDDRYAPIWFTGIGIAQKLTPMTSMTDYERYQGQRYFLTTIGTVIYEELIENK